MNYITGENLSKDLGERILFQNIDISINKGEKVALIANNGTGKSTLLKILAGEQPSQTGEVRLRKGIKMAYLSQAPSFDGYQTIQDLIDFSSSATLGIIRDYEAALEAQSTNFNETTQRNLENASNLMDQADAWDYDRKLKEYLTLFQVTDYTQKIENLSGGQKKRLSIALTLIQNPDLLLLDEPTNHLDVSMIEWLENYLSRATMSLLMVSHDRYFLDAVCNKIIEMDNSKLFQYNGNYAYFLEKKALREQMDAITIGKAQQLMKTELEWMRRSPQARTTKSKSRIQAFYETEDKAKSGVRKDSLELEVKMTRIGGKILELKKVYKSFDQLQILNGFDYTFKKGDRIGVVGKNGCGKSTFLNIIMGLEQADSGKINRGETIIFGYYSQQGMNLKEDKRIIEVLKDVADVITLADGSSISASQMLTRFLFPPDMQYQYVSKLSGGEKKRLFLLMILMQNPNFLILDEPTNDLDIVTLNILEEFLENFQGCLLLVSHDRYFLDKLVDHLFVFEGQGEIKDYNGSFTEYRLEQVQKTKDDRAEKQNKIEPQKNIEPEKTKTKLSFKEKYEFEELEKELEKLEAEKAKLEESLTNQTTDYEQITNISEKLSAISSLIETKTDRWLFLSEFA